jgi:hypothetical protein
MIKALTSLLARPSSLYADVELDHIELTGERLILGAKIKWINTTPETLEIRGVKIHLFDGEKRETPVRLHYYDRFVRIPYQKAVGKIAYATSFHVGSGATQTQSLRFLTHEISDLNAGTYAAELHSIVPQGTYVHEFELKVVPEFKYNTSKFESEKGQTGPLSALHLRAIRIGTS